MRKIILAAAVAGAALTLAACSEAETEVPADDTAMVPADPIAPAEPVVTDPAVTDPAATPPAATDPAVTDPAATPPADPAAPAAAQ